MLIDSRDQSSSQHPLLLQCTHCRFVSVARKGVGVLTFNRTDLRVDDRPEAMPFTDMRANFLLQLPSFARCNAGEPPQFCCSSPSTNSLHISPKRIPKNALAMSGVGVVRLVGPIQSLSRQMATGSSQVGSTYPQQCCRRRSPKFRRFSSQKTSSGTTELCGLKFVALLVMLGNNLQLTGRIRQ
jgi:hypothetical protein